MRSTDFFISRGNVPIGHIETKDIAEDLDKVEKSDQLQRYFSSLSNLVLTNYLEFRWYVDGKERFRGRIGWLNSSRKLIVETGHLEGVLSIINGFLSYKHGIISSPRELAIRMAKQAKIIRDSAKALYNFEPEDGQLHSHLKILKETLVPDLDLEAFCDMFAQTVSYGLFAAKIANVETSLTRENAGFVVPRTNPFLRKFFNELAGPDLDESIAWTLDDLITVLNQSRMDKILEHFLKRRDKDDAVVHFYETFLTEYNPEERFAKGIFYTPFPVVSFIVRSVDKILRSHFSCAGGIADPSKVQIRIGDIVQETHKVLILDPAVGTGTFLSTTINHIEDQFKDNLGLFTSYVQEHIVPRLFGFELLMAPYAVAHMKISLRLTAIGYDFASDERLRIFLTNTLDDPLRRSEVLFSNWVSKEGNLATEVKRDLPIMVIMGNPPYSGVSANKGNGLRT